MAVHLLALSFKGPPFSSSKRKVVIRVLTEWAKGSFLELPFSLQKKLSFLESMYLSYIGVDMSQYEHP